MKFLHPFLRVSGTVGTFFFFSSALSMVLARKELIISLHINHSERFLSWSLLGDNSLVFLCVLQAKALLDFFIELSFRDVCLGNKVGRQRYYSLEQSSSLFALHHFLSLFRLLQQNTIDRAAYEQQKCISQSSGG